MQVVEIQIGSAPPPPPPPQITLGLDLGQPGETVALAVVETTWSGNVGAHALRHLERFVPGVPYSTMLARVREIRAPLHDPPLVLDATSAGAPIVERFRDLPGASTIVVLTNGTGSTREGDIHRVSLRDVVGQAQLCLQEGRLRVSRGLDLAGELARELRSFRLKQTAATDPVPWRTGASDDLVYACSLALWQAEEWRPCTWPEPKHHPFTFGDGSFR